MSGKANFAVSELEVHSRGNARLVWYWYAVGDTSSASAVDAKIAEVVAFGWGRYQSSGIVILSMPVGALVEDARDVLHEFTLAFYPAFEGCNGEETFIGNCVSNNENQERS